MRFSGRRQVGAPAPAVWTALHDTEVLRDIIPGCHDIRPVADGGYAAALQARVGPLSDTYRGRFGIEDLRAGQALLVTVDARGRCGRLAVTLHVTLEPGPDGTTELTYDADAEVGGLAGRLGRATLTVTGGHFTGCFFRSLDRAVRSRAVVRTQRQRVPVAAAS